MNGIIAAPGRIRRAALEQPLPCRATTVALAVAVAAVELTAFAVVWDPTHWGPLWLVLLLGAFMVAGEVAAVRVGRVYLASTTCATVLAMALLGPVPAATLVAIALGAEWLVQRKALWAGLTNVTQFSLVALVGGLLIESAGGSSAGGRYAATVFLVGVSMALLNLVLVVAYRKLWLEASIRADLRESFLPTIPYELLGITLAAAAAEIVETGDFPTVGAILPALLVSEFVLRYIAAGQTRAEEVMTLTQERANLLEQALTAEVAEREWIAGHVHDETLQTLALVRQELDEAATGDVAAVTAARTHLDTAVGELRRTLAHVHPGSITRHGLEAALESYAAQVFARRGVQWKVDVAPGVGEEQQALLYSLARELLGNAAKHARATRVSLQAVRHGDRIRLSVDDDGAGFAPGAADAPGHFGLLTVRHRVTAAGGTLRIADGPGARIAIELPA